MYLLEAELSDFRNYATAKLEPSREITALIGENGQGKTNLLEALYLIAGLRPLRSVPRRALVRNGTRRASIRLRVQRRSTGLTHDLELALEGSSRVLSKDGKKVATDSFLGTLVAVAFTPDDLQLAKSGPDGRRRFIDRALLNARPQYLGRALRYARAVRERNQLLAKDGDDAELDAFDALIATEGAAILSARQDYVARLAPRVVERFQDIARPAPPLEVRYRSTVEAGDEELAERLLASLGARRESDRRRRTTSVGPHLDDLVFELGGAAVKERASQGQHRALILALKLVELELLSASLQEPPILLLDDMSSELDPGRTRQLFESVGELEGQVVLTSTSEPSQLRDVIGADRDFVVQEVAEGELGPPRQMTLTA